MTELHILFISSWYPGRNNVTHGIFNRNFALAAALRSRVSVLHVSPDPGLTKGYSAESFDDAGIFTVQVYYPAAKRLPSFLGKIMQHLRRLHAYKKGFKIIREQKGLPDVIQLNVVLPAGPGATMLSRAYNIPLVVNECWTGYDPLDGRYSGLAMKLLTKRVLRRARVVMPVTSYMRKVMEQHHLEASYRIIPNVVDTETFKPVPAANKDALRLIHVSALDDAQKNVRGILAAVRSAAERLPALRLVIAGDGPDAGLLKQKTVDMGISDRVRFAGRLSAVELAAELNAADALIMFSNFESFCVAVPEALACGKPVITSDAGGIMSYFTRELGLVVPAGDTVALAQAIVELSQRRQDFDPQFLRGFVVDRFTPRVVGDLLHEVYQKVTTAS
jgi:glycosyltransferase involved in cell wall biosynthesis